MSRIYSSQISHVHVKTEASPTNDWLSGCHFRYIVPACSFASNHVPGHSMYPAVCIDVFGISCSASKPPHLAGNSYQFPFNRVMDKMRNKDHHIGPRHQATTQNVRGTPSSNTQAELYCAIFTAQDTTRVTHGRDAGNVSATGLLHACRRSRLRLL